MDWNYDDWDEIGDYFVFLHAREWIEIQKVLDEIADNGVFLHAREWIEIVKMVNDKIEQMVFLHAREWIEITDDQMKDTANESFSMRESGLKLYMPPMRR